MHIVDSPLKSYHDFELDMAAIGLKSVERDWIVLPYTGPLPDDLKDQVRVDSVAISFNLQPTQKTRITLTASLSCGKEFRRPLEASVEQICGLLDRFFSQKENGLDEFSWGAWQADYAAWRVLKTEPLRMVNVLQEYSQEDLSRILYYLNAEA